MRDEQPPDPPTEEEQAVAHRRFLMRLSDWELAGSTMALDPVTGLPLDPQPDGRRIDPDTGHVVLSHEEGEAWEAWDERYDRETASDEDMRVWRQWKASMEHNDSDATD